MITERREERIKHVVAQRQPNLTVILENVHDPHNIGAVLRSCDSVGVGEIYVLLTEKGIPPSRYIGVSSASGAKKWVDVHFFTSVNECFTVVRTKYDNIFGTHLDGESRSLYEMDLTDSCALLFGNEHDGISAEALKQVDGNFIIPQVGMVRSLNISVACAVTLYEAYRQRNVKGYYGKQYEESMLPYFRKYVNKTRNIDQ